MAVLWRAALSPDYVDGRFFRVTLLTDERFAEASLGSAGFPASRWPRTARSFPDVPETLREAAQLGNLVPFVGAGASQRWPGRHHVGARARS